jgi:hypothetical protein
MPVTCTRIFRQERRADQMKAVLPPPNCRSDALSVGHDCNWTLFLSSLWTPSIRCACISRSLYDYDGTTTSKVLKHGPAGKDPRRFLPCLLPPVASNLYSNFSYIRVRSFILSGAPFHPNRLTLLEHPVRLSRLLRLRATGSDECRVSHACSPVAGWRSRVASSPVRLRWGAS